MLIEQELKKYIIIFYSLIVLSAIFLATSSNLLQYQNNCISSASIVARVPAPSGKEEIVVNLEKVRSAEKLLTKSLRGQLKSTSWEYKEDCSQSQQYSSFVVEGLKMIAKSVGWYIIVFRFLSIVGLILAVNIIVYCRSLY